MVETSNERDVEAGHVVSKTKVDVCRRPLVTNLEVDRASGLRPSCAVGDSGNVGAYGCMLAVCEGRLALR